MSRAEKQNGALKAPFCLNLVGDTWIEHVTPAV